MMGAISGRTRRLGDESGQVLIVAALAMTALLGFVALGTDVGLMFYVRRSAQTAADSAAITAAQELKYGDAVSAAKADASLNGFTDGASGTTVTVNSPPASGANAGIAGYVEVIVNRAQPTVFMRALSRKSMAVTARAVATLGKTKNCVYTLGTSGSDISLTGGVQVDMTDCNLYGNSTSSSDLSASGGASLTASTINLSGGQSVSGGAHVSAAMNTGIPAVSDPLGYLNPPSFTSSSCLPDPGKNGAWGTYNIGPASSGGTVCYNGMKFANGATATLNPGLYIINGTLSFQGGTTVTGTGVTFYLPVGASLDIANGANETLTAPTSGTYNGILFYQDRQNSTGETLQGGASSVFQGILYFPAANFTFTGGTSTNTYASIISRSLTFSGGTKVKNYADINSATPLAAPRLVE